MVALMGLLTGEFLFETAKFIVMLFLLVAAFLLGGKLRDKSDAKKAAKNKDDADNATTV